VVVEEKGHDCSTSGSGFILRPSIILNSHNATWNPTTNCDYSHEPWWFLKRFLKRYLDSTYSRKRCSTATVGGGRGGGRPGGFQANAGPPDTVLGACMGDGLSRHFLTGSSSEMGSFIHAVEDEMLCSSLMPDKVPYFNAPIYLQNKSQIGKVDEILGPINEVYFSIKMDSGVIASSFKKGDKVYIGGDKLLPLERFLPKPKIPGPFPFRLLISLELMKHALQV
jgi:rRNA processing protein Gar1